jgi:hypothetical protein
MLYGMCRDQLSSLYLIRLSSQAPAALRVSLAVLGEGGTLQLKAGGVVPAVDVTVENGAGRCWAASSRR